MDLRRLTFWVLAVAGVAVGHVIGYGLAHPDQAARELALVGHSYFSPVATVVVPAGVVLLLVYAVRTGRDLGMGDDLSAARLAGVQLGLFSVQEIVEAFAAGSGISGFAGERGVWFGLVAQVVVARVVVEAVRFVRCVVRCLQAGAASRGERLALPLPAAARRPLVPVMAVVAVGPRAPPSGDRP